MKKTLIIVLTFLILASVGFAGYLFLQKTDDRLNTVLPEGAVATFEVHDFKKTLGQLSQSPLWKDFAQLDIDTLAKKRVVDDRLKSFYDIIVDFVENPSSQTYANMLLGHEFAIGLYPLKADPNSSAPLVADPLAGAVLVTRVEPDAQFIELIARLLQQPAKDVRIKKIKYGEHLLRVVNVNTMGVQVVYVRVKDLVLAGLSTRVVKNVLDVLDEDALSLSQDIHYTEASQSHMKDSDFAFYWHIYETFDLIKLGVQKYLMATDMDSPAAQERLDEFLQQFSGFNYFAFSVVWDMLTEMNAVMHFDQEELHPGVASNYVTCQSGENKTLEFPPQESLVYYWNRCLDLGKKWDEMIDTLKKAGPKASGVDPTQQVKVIEQTLGLSMRDQVIPAFGNEIGGYVTDVNMEGMFPIPKFLFFIQVLDQEIVQAILDKLKTLPFFVLQTEDYDQTTINYLSLPLGSDVEPSFGFYKDFLMIAMNRQLMKSSIDAAKNGSSSLARQDSFRALKLNSKEESTDILFIDMDQVTSVVRDVVDYTLQWQEKENLKKNAFQKGSENRLKDAQDSVRKMMSGKKELNDKVLSLNKQIKDLEGTNQDATQAKADLADVYKAITALDVELTGAREQLIEIDGIVKEFKKNSRAINQKQMALEMFMYPLLESLQAIDSLGTRSFSQEGNIESKIFFKLKEQ